MNKPLQRYFDKQADEYMHGKRKRRMRGFWRLVVCFIVAMVVFWWLANVGSPRIKYM